MNRAIDYSIEIDQSSSRTMTSALAGKIDGARKELKLDFDGSLERRARNESKQHLEYRISF